MPLDDGFQRLLAGGDVPALSLNAQAALGPVRAPERSEFSHLLRHFLERFFHHESASPDGDAKTRLVQIAFAAGLPGFMVAIYLWPVYHPVLSWLPGAHGGPPSYWLQVNHHFFFVIYSFVALGIATVFEWDMFFPDLLDIFVLGTLPVAGGGVFLARVAAIGVFICGFLFDANFLAPMVLPMAMDPPHLGRFLAAHILAVTGSGLFAAALILATEGVLVAVLGERLMAKLSLLLQGLSIAALLMLLLLFPVLSGAVPVLLDHGSALVRWLPPFWFLGIYQLLLEGPSARPIYEQLAQTGCAALIAAILLAVAAYPVAYLRRMSQLVEGRPTRTREGRVQRGAGHLLHLIAIRPPAMRAVFHFIGQTLARVPRYRIYLVLYGGAGLSVVLSSLLRLHVSGGQVLVEISPDGLRAAAGILAFWVIAGLRISFLSPGNRRGSWVFRIAHGTPPPFPIAMQQCNAAYAWALLCSISITGGAWLILRVLAPSALRTPASAAAQLLVVAAMCLLLTDLLFLNVTTIAFTGKPEREQPNLALSVGKFLLFFPIVSSLPVQLEPWIESSTVHLVQAALFVAFAHAALRRRHRQVVTEYCNALELEDDEEEFPMRLGLRY